MGIEQQQFHRCYLLHRRSFRETSLLLEIFSEEYGRIGAIARGAKSARGGMTATLQPFQLLDISWGGYGELKKVFKAELVEGGRPLQGEMLIAGFYLNELMMHLLHRDDPHSELFQIYHTTIKQLSEGCEDLEWTLRQYEKQLMETIGYGLLLTHEAEHGEIVTSDQRYCYLLEQGPVKMKSHCVGIEISGKTLLHLDSGELPDDTVRKESKKLMRYLIASQTGNKTLNSRKLFSHKRQ